MTTAKEQMIADAQVLIPVDDNVHPGAEDVIYTPKATGVAKPIRAIVDLAFDENLGGFVDSVLSILILSDPTQGITSPVAGDLVTARGRVTRVVNYTSDPDGFHDLAVAIGGVA